MSTPLTAVIRRVDRLRQAACNRLAGVEDIKDAERLAWPSDAAGRWWPCHRRTADVHVRVVL